MVNIFDELTAQDKKQLDDLKAMREASRLNQQVILAEQLGTASLKKGKSLRKPNLIRRILGLK